MTGEYLKHATQYVRNHILDFLKWIGKVTIPGIIVAIFVIWVKDEKSHDLPEFQARIEHIAPEDYDGKPAYKVIIKNTGPGPAPGIDGELKISFRGIIENIPYKRLPHNSEFRDDDGKKIKSCEGKTSCVIVWGAINPGGYIEIKFEPEGPLLQIPSALYLMKTITWSCNDLQFDHLNAKCKENKLSPK